jgi:phosphoribosylaminoimidazole (AIR) synthetase
MGIGMILVVNPKEAAATRKILENCGEKVFEIGKVTEKCDFDVVIR